MKVIKSLENREILLKGTARKIISQEERFLNFVGPLLKTGLPLVKTVLTPLAKSVLIPLRLTAAKPATNGAIQKKLFRSGMTALLISNEKMEDIIKIVKSFEELNLLKNWVF